MFTSVSASQYKAWRTTGDIKLAPVTGFFGANSSGKSSLLQLFLLLKQTVQSPDNSKVLDLGGSANTLVSVGSWQDLCFGRSIPDVVELSFGWTPTLARAIAVYERHSDTPTYAIDLPTLTFSTTISVSSTGAFARRFSYVSDQLDVEMSRWHPRNPSVSWNTLTASSHDGRSLLRPLDAGEFFLPTPTHCYGFPSEVFGHYENADFLRDLHLELEHQFKHRLYYLGPHRDKGQRRYIWHGSEPADVGASGERTVDALLASRDRGRNNATAVTDNGKTEELVSVDEHVARMLRSVGLVSEFSVERASEGSELYRVKVQLSRTSIPVDLMDVGFGVSQVLPLLVLLAYVPEGSTVVLEQPEMHLHPRVQSKLADVFIDVATARNLQVIFESHSEHMLMRLQRRVAEQTVDADQVALYFCENDGVSSNLSKLELDECGSIANWPKDFFGDALGETAAIVSAGLRHRSETEA